MRLIQTGTIWIRKHGEAVRVQRKPGARLPKHIPRLKANMGHPEMQQIDKLLMSRKSTRSGD